MSNELSDGWKSSDPADLAEILVAALNRSSPLIGADGPPDQPGPEEPYIRALEGVQDSERQRFGEAVRIILLQDAAEIARTGTVSRPLLLYNLFSLLEAVVLPRAAEVLQTLREEEGPLAQALADQGDDLYAQLLIAHAVNQHASRQDLEFWLRLLQHPNTDYVSAGVVGLRESGWENALAYLPAVRAAHQLHPELGPLEDEIMLLIDTYPESNWPDCARDYITDGEIWESINKHGLDRYVPNIDELSGHAAEIIRRAGKSAEVARQHSRYRGSPARALVGGINGY